MKHLWQPLLLDRGDPLPPVLASGVTPESKQASVAAGEANRRSGAGASQRVRMLIEYCAAGVTGCTDAELAHTLGMRRHVVPARRAELMKTYRFGTDGRRDGSTVWIFKGARDGAQS